MIQEMTYLTASYAASYPRFRASSIRINTTSNGKKPLISAEQKWISSSCECRTLHRTSLLFLSHVSTRGCKYSGMLFVLKAIQMLKKCNVIIVLRTIPPFSHHFLYPSDRRSSLIFPKKKDQHADPTSSCHNRIRSHTHSRRIHNRTRNHIRTDDRPGRRWKA